MTFLTIPFPMLNKSLWTLISGSTFFKKFRRSADSKAVVTSAAAFAKKILSMSSRHTIPSNEIDIQQALNDFGTGDVDFNDAVLANICRKHGFKLLTNDADFQSGGIEVLTTNPKLLQVCL